MLPSFDDIGGVTSMAKFLLRGIRQRGDMDVRIVSLATSRRDPLSVLVSRPSTWFRGVRTARAEAHGEEYVRVGAFLGEIELFRLKPRGALRNLFADCDLVQLVAGAPSWICTLSDVQKPIVAYVATMVDIERRRPLSLATGLSGKWRKFMTDFAVRMDYDGLKVADEVFVMNTWMQRHCSEHTIKGIDNVHYGPPGVDSTTFTPLAERTPSRSYILSVGRLSDERKNAALLLNAYSKAAAAKADLPDLVLAGAGDMPDWFWQRVRQFGLEGRVRHIPNPSIAALADIYRNAQCFVMSSDEEGFGIVVIEAMASGIPMIATRCGGPEDVVADGVNGYLVDRDDADAMADRMIRLASDVHLNLKMGTEALNTVQARFTSEAAFRPYSEIYDRILAQLAR